MEKIEMFAVLFAVCVFLSSIQGGELVPGDGKKYFRIMKKRFLNYFREIFI